MKKLLLLLPIVATCGCKVLSPHSAVPPTDLELKFLEVSNAVIDRVVTRTNFVTQTVTNIEARIVTNEFNVPRIVLITNFVDIPVPSLISETQRVTVPQLVPGAGAQASKGIGELIGGLFGVGGLVGTLLGGGLATYLKMRNRALAGDNDSLSLATGGLVQTTETILQVLSQTPQGQALRPKVVKYLEEHQRDLGTIETIREYLSLISKSRSLDDAQEILDKLKTP